MTIWEKILVNVEKGARKVSVGAAMFSDRVKVEFALARLRIRMNEVRSLIKEQEQIIGRKVVELKRKEELPRTIEQLMADEDIVAALAEIASREKDLEEIKDEIAREQAVMTEEEDSREDAAR